MLIELATAIRARRLKLGLSEEQLSEKLGISVSVLREIERGVTDLDVVLMHSTAGELGWSTGFLMRRIQMLCRASESQHRRMKSAIQTQRQLDELEKQHERLIKQQERLTKQTEILPRCWSLVASLEADGRLVRKNESKRKQNIELMQEKLKKQKASMVERKLQLNRVRKSIDEQERFLMRRQRPIEIVN